MRAASHETGRPSRQPRRAARLMKALAADLITTVTLVALLLRAIHPTTPAPTPKRGTQR